MKKKQVSILSTDFLSKKMDKIFDNVVGKVYETNDYEKFVISPENRGEVSSGGISLRKKKELNKTYESGKFIAEYPVLRVNENFEVIDGAHYLDLCKSKNIPVRYIFVKSDIFTSMKSSDFSNATIRVNRLPSSWSRKQIFIHLVEKGNELALKIQKIIMHYNEKFDDMKILAIVAKNTAYFYGVKQSNYSGDTFSIKEYLTRINSKEFKRDINTFSELNDKFKSQRQPSKFFKSLYALVWYNNNKINTDIFIEAMLKLSKGETNGLSIIPRSKLQSKMLSYYNRALKKMGKDDLIIKSSTIGKMLRDIKILEAKKIASLDETSSVENTNTESILNVAY